MSQHLVDLLADGELLVPSASLPDDLIGRKPTTLPGHEAA
jgi:hypothetical protein